MWLLFFFSVLSEVAAATVFAAEVELAEEPAVVVVVVQVVPAVQPPAVAALVVQPLASYWHQRRDWVNTGTVCIWPCMDPVCMVRNNSNICQIR